MTAALGDTTHWVHARGDQQHARHAQEARECRLMLVFLPFSPLGARVRSTVRHRTRSTLDVTYSHKVVLQSSHWLDCFWGIDCCIKAWCCGSHEKADRKCLTKVYRMHPHPSTLAVRGGLRSQPGDGAGTQERRAGQIWLYGRTGHPWGCTGQP